VDEVSASLFVARPSLEEEDEEEEEEEEEFATARGEVRPVPCCTRATVLSANRSPCVAPPHPRWGLAKQGQYL